MNCALLLCENVYEPQEQEQIQLMDAVCENL
jgi:hypothetical protein